jgi:putative ABC transport system permease protein
VVGYGNYPFFTTFDRGTSSIGDGSTDGYILIPFGDFKIADEEEGIVYHSAYLTLKGAKDLICYSDDYEDKVDAVIERLKTLEDEISKSVETMTQFKQDSEKQSSNEALVHVVTVANAVSKVSSDDIYKRVQKSPDEIARAEAFAKEIEERVGKVKQLMADGKKTFSWIDKVFMYDKEKEAVVEGGGEFRTFVQEISGLIRKIGGKLMHADIQATSIVAKGVSKEMNFVKACNQLTAKASGGEQS